MENENGTWIMYGVEWDDPECLHTVQDAIDGIPLKETVDDDYKKSI